MSILYHYTTASTLLGILDKCSVEKPYVTIWATHASFLNDPTEYKLGKIVCQNIINEFEEDLKIPDNERLLKNFLNETIQKSIELSDFFSSATTIMEGGIPYIISLSRNRDSLPMWNTYTQKGNSIAIGFDEQLLCEESARFGKEKNSMLREIYEIRECIYDTLESGFISIKNRYKEEYIEVLNNYKKQKNATDGDYIKEILNRAKVYAFMERLYKEIAPYIKDKVYEYEQEVRCLVKNKDKIFFRESNGLIIPYVKVKISLKCIKEIIIGPTMDANRTRDSLAMLLYNKGMIDILSNPERIIKISNAPYRG